jgi:ribose-phosphate pyrophosphokinase
MSPDEHIKDLDRAINAISGRIRKLYIIMPQLYQSRQDKRNEKKESLDCAAELYILEETAKKLTEIITFDAHNVGVENALRNTGFSNIFPTITILNKILDDNPDIVKNLLVI